MIFRPPSITRERLPVINAEAVGRAIEIRDQVGILRLLPGDRLRIVEERGDHALCSHPAATACFSSIAACSKSNPETSSIYEPYRPSQPHL